MHYLFLICAAVLCLRGSGLAAQSAVPHFPADWVGNWAGTLTIYTAAGTAQSLPMQLRIQPLGDGRYTYHIIYGPDEATGLRPYELVPVNPGQGIWRIDEQNGIAMEAYVRGPALYSRFEVMGTLLLSTVAHEGESLRYEIIAGPLVPASVTGNATVNGEQIPEVKTYPVPTAQVGRLWRME